MSPEKEREMKKQISKFSFVALSLLVVGVNTFAQITHNRTLKNEGMRQLANAARKVASTKKLPDGVIPKADEKKILGSTPRKGMPAVIEQPFLPSHGPIALHSPRTRAAKIISKNL